VFVVEDFIGESKAGEVVKLESNGSDLLTLWIIRAFLNMFAVVGVGGSVSFSALDDTGASRTFVMKGNFGSGNNHIFTTYSCSQFVRVRFGSDPTPPSRTDFRLLQEVFVDVNTRVSLNEDAGYALIEGTAIFPSDTTVCEVGLSLGATVNSYMVCGEILIDRTVLNPCRTVPANTPYVVRYRLQV
jgi:hypothetical protein